MIHVQFAQDKHAMHMTKDFQITSDSLDSDSMTVLRMRLMKAGCFERTPLAYAMRLVLVSAGYAGGYLGLISSDDLRIRAVSILLVAVSTVQAGFIAHDVGDGAVTTSRRLSLLLQQLLMSFLSALSSTYFLHLHRAHHVTVHRGLNNPRLGTANFNPFEFHALKRMLATNELLFAVGTICLRGVTFKIESLRYVAAHWQQTAVDRLMMALHGLFWLVLPLPFIDPLSMVVNYTCIMIAGGVYIGTVLVLNHAGMSNLETLTTKSFMDRTLLSTRNLSASRTANLLLGGISNHIEHHLFPQIPITRLPRARMVSEAFFRERGLPYQSVGFLAAFVSAIRHFQGLTVEARVAQALS